MRGGGWAPLAALLAIMLFCWGMAINCGTQMLDTGGVTLYLPAAGESYDSLEKAEQRTEQPVAFTTWGQLDGQQIKSVELDRAHTVSVVTMWGDSTLALPELSMLLPGSSGCLLDRASCYALFGDFAPIGAVVELDGIKYTVAGVFDYPSGMLVRQGKANSDGGWNRVTLSLADAPDPDGAAQEFSMRHGLAPYAVLSTGLWHGLAGVYIQLLPLLVLGSILLYGLRYAFVRRETPILSGLVLLGTLAAAVALWLVCGMGFTVPVSLVPARWSDFEFWSAAFSHGKAQLWLVLTLPKELPQALPMRWALYSVLWGGVAALLYIPCLKSLRTIWNRVGGYPLIE